MLGYVPMDLDATYGKVLTELHTVAFRLAVRDKNMDTFSEKRGVNLKYGTGFGTFK